MIFLTCIWFPEQDAEVGSEETGSDKEKLSSDSSVSPPGEKEAEDKNSEGEKVCDRKTLDTSQDKTPDRKASDNDMVKVREVPSCGCV